jgi:hypothetical protein
MNTSQTHRSEKSVFITDFKPEAFAIMEHGSDKH